MNISLISILEKLPVKKTVGNINRAIQNVISIADAQPGVSDIAWLSDKNLDKITTIDKGVIICSTNCERYKLNDECTYLIVDNPRLYFLNLLSGFFIEDEQPFVSNKSIIDPSVILGTNVTIHPGVVLEKDCRVGNETVIDSNTVIKRGTIIGDRVRIGANNTIGGNGFGYEKTESGEFVLIPHIGNVVIEDDVEIGNNTTIDRAVLGSTVLRRNCKIDNLVHIAHGVEIGENSLIIANSLIGGSTKVGKNVWVSPSVSILNKIHIGDDSLVGMGAVVLKNVETKQTVVGNPAKDITLLQKKN